jgi:two-component system OmpR family sensor kinase
VWSLRAKLIAGQVAMLTVVLVLILGVTEFALSHFLTGQVDHQLYDAAQRLSSQSSHPGPVPHGLPPPLAARGNAPDTIGAVIVDGQLALANRQDKSGALLALSPTTYPTLVSVSPGQKPTTKNLGELGDYRFIAASVGPDTVIVTGLPLNRMQDTLSSLALIFAGVALVGLTVTGAIGALTVRRTLRPLERMAATATRVSELPLERGEVALSLRVPHSDTDPRTEVGKMGAALNRMLGHVARSLSIRHASEMRVRQFVADASHELRTPLSSIRGHAELINRHSLELPEDIAYSLSRMEAESVRMSHLVDDLLLLARLDAGRPLERESVDLSQLVVNAVSDAHAAGRDHEWRLDIPDEPVTASGDRARLHQVLANLLNNARTHTPAGTTVRAGLHVADDQVHVTVSDNGPGIPEALLPQVFERFARGDSSRSRAAGSTGLGLAIVAAVVSAHGGSVDVRSSDAGTEFTVALPNLAQPNLA